MTGALVGSGGAVARVAAMAGLSPSPSPSPSSSLPPEIDPARVTPGLLGLFFFVALAVAVFFLWRSMNTQLGRIQVPDDAPATDAAASADTDAAPATDAAASADDADPVRAATAGPVTGPPRPASDPTHRPSGPARSADDPDPDQHPG